MALAGYSLWPDGDGRTVHWRQLSAGPLTLGRETERLYREPDAFATHLTAVGGHPPAVDFDSRQVLLISPGPRSSTGYELEVIDVRERNETLAVRVRERTPGVEDEVLPRVTFPYRLISLPAGKDVHVEWEGR